MFYKAVPLEKHLSKLNLHFINALRKNCAEFLQFTKYSLALNFSAGGTNTNNLSEQLILKEKVAKFPRCNGIKSF